MYSTLFKQMNKTLGQVDTWLVAAAAHAEKKGFDAKHFLQLRLVVDQFPFVRQVQMTCDTAKLGASRVTGKEAPSHADSEQTIDELRERIRATRAYLDGFTEADFEGAATRVISNPRWEGKTAVGADFFVEHVVPNFFFHATTAYAILRQNGVEIGKKDYLGPQTRK